MPNKETVRTGQMNKEDFLKRCETIYDKGFADRGLFWLMNKWLDFTMRFEHTMCGRGGQSQGIYALDFLNEERERLSNRTLANDDDGYNIIELAAILSHPCQKCAEEVKQWHTRTAFCDHKKEEEHVRHCGGEDE